MIYDALYGAVWLTDIYLIELYHILGRALILTDCMNYYKYD